MKKRHLTTLWVVLSLILLAVGCNIPSEFEFDIETTNELGPETLARIDAVNRTLATGMEVGPETRQVIRELNETIRQGMKAGFDEATLKRVDDLLRVVEDGLKIGLDEDTLATLNGLVEVIDRQPGQWESAGTEIIRTLERSGGTMAGRMADEIKGVMNEARLNMQQMTAIAGTEFRCNVDFLGAKAGATLHEFIGHTIVGKLRNILSGRPATEPIPTPWVCQVIPESVEVVRVGEQLLFPAGLITLTGYNYVDANAPRAYVADETGNPIPGLQLFPYRTSPYQIQLNLQGLDFSAVPPRSRIVFAWPNVPETTGVAILMPVANPPVARFTFSPRGGSAPLTVQFTDTSSGDPAEWSWDFGDGATSNERNPTHTFMEARRYTVQLTVTNPLGSSTASEVLVVGEALTAGFTFSPRQGEAPLVVQFTDRSGGNPTAWAWNFGDGQTSDEQNPSHIYTTPRPEGYSVTLRVSSAEDTATYTAPDRVIVLERVQADFTAAPTRGQPPLTVAFQDTSRGSHIVAWQWDFGDGTTSTERNPVHTYTTSNLYDVRLTVTTAEGRSDTVSKPGFINAFKLLSGWRPGLIPLDPLFAILNNVEAHFAQFPLRGGQVLDTGWSADQFVCGVVGMLASNGDIYEDGHGDILKAYLSPQYSPAHGKSTWWLTADFRTHSDKAEETWVITLLCLDRKGEGGVFDYIEKRDLPSGDDEGKAVYDTGLHKDEYIFCGVVGQAAKWGDINENGVHAVVWQAYAALSGDYWMLYLDFVTHNRPEETWNANLLCIHRGSYLATEKPTFLFRHYPEFLRQNGLYLTDIPTRDYACGVVGVDARLGDLLEVGTQRILLEAEMVPQGAVWGILTDIATHGDREETWSVDVLCVNRAVVKTLPPGW
jgi:PKD repeat protein